MTIVWWNIWKKTTTMRGLFAIVLCSVFLYLNNVKSLQVIPERAIRTSINEKYVYPNGTIFISRYGRKSAYYINIEGTNKMTFGNNVSLHLIFYEFLHNEYKRSFVEMHFNLCDMYNSDPYVGGALRLIDFKCPLAPGTYRLHNLTVPMDNFPSLWPFERCKVVSSLVQSPTKDVIASADVYLYFKQKPRHG